MRRLYLNLLLLVLFTPAFADTIEWRLKDAWGEEVQYNQQTQQQPTLLFFWASWCPFCHRLMPGFQRIYDEYRHRGVTIYSINVWETGDALAYMFDHDYEFPVLVEGEPVAAIYGIKGTPALLVIAPDGEVVYRRREGDDPEMVERLARENLDALLKKS